MKSHLRLIINDSFFCLLPASVAHIEANPDAKRLYDDLLSNYNRLIRPVVNNTETLTVWLGLKLSQLINPTFSSIPLQSNRLAI